MSYWDEKHSEEKDDFQKECVAVGQTISGKGANMFLCCIDGSNQSDLAFQSALNLRRKFDHLCVFHAFKGNKPDLQPATWRPKQLETKYECELIGHIPKRLHSMCWVDREGDAVSDIIQRIVATENFEVDSATPSPLPGKPDFIVMGHHGRKGPKESRSAIGSTADQALRQLHYPVLVIKNALSAGPRSFLMAVDESNVSKRGLDILMRIVNPKDTLVLVHFTHSLQHDIKLAQQKHLIKDYYEKELDSVGPVGSKFEFVEYEHGSDLTSAIIEYVSSSTADVLAIAPRASRDRSSITEYIVNHVPISVLLCKS